MILNATAGAVIAAVYLFVFGLIGMAAGGLVHLFARRRWGWKAAAADWALAVAAVLFLEVVLLLVNSAFGVYDWSLTPDVAVSVAAVVARRLAPLVWRRKGTVGGNGPS